MRPKLQVFPLVHFSPQVLTFLFVYAYAYTLKACVGLFLSVTKTFFARNLRYLNWYIAIQSAITFSSEVLDNFYSMISLPKHCCEPAKILARNWFQQKIIWYMFANTLQCSRIISRYAEVRGERLRISVVKIALPWLWQKTARKDSERWLRGAKLS